MYIEPCRKHMERTLIATDVTYSADQQAVDQLEADLKNHMYDKNPKRFAHSISVGRCANALRAYMMRICQRSCCGYFAVGETSSWCETIELARALSYQTKLLIRKLLDLHGPLAAKTLPAIYPWLSEQILSAIQKHTAERPSDEQTR